MNKPILLTVLSTDTLVDIRDTITAGDSDAYPLSITFSDLTAITGTVRFRFVRGDAYWDRDATIDGNTVSLMLEPDFYAAPGTELWLSFQESNLYTPLHVYFRNIRVPGGNVAAETSQPYPTWAADMREFDVAIGTVETLDPGADATASITGDVPDKVLNLGIPQGVQGDAATIEVGTVTTLTAGESATVGNSGTPGAAVLDFGIPKGDKGDAGEMTIGTVTTLAPGESATMTNSGTSTDAVLDIAIPAGYDGSAVPIDDASSAADRVLSASYIKGQLADKADVTQEAWITPTLMNGWTGDVKYRKDNFGIVHFKGKLIPGTGTAFRLPSQYAPSQTLTFLVPNNSNLSIRLGRCVVEMPSRNVWFREIIEQDWLDISVITYFAEV